MTILLWDFFIIAVSFIAGLFNRSIYYDIFAAKLVYNHFCILFSSEMYSFNSRSAEGLEIRQDSCSVKGVMVHTIVTVSNLLTRLDLASLSL